MNDAIKITVAHQIGGGRPFRREGATSFRFSSGLAHFRFKTKGPFSFNINPASLKADYEVWICARGEDYYLLPRSVVQGIYRHPAAYVDQRHPKIRVVSVDTNGHTATFARGGEKLDLRPYFRSKIDPPAV